MLSLNQRRKYFFFFDKSKHPVTALASLILFLLFGLAGSAFSQDPEHSFMNLEVSRRVSHLISLEEYDSALEIGDSLDRKNPGNPFGAFIKATVLNFRKVDFEDDVDDSLMLLTCDEVEDLCGYFDDIENEKLEAELLFFKGSIELYRMLVSKDEGKLLTTLKQIKSAGNQLKKAINTDSTCWEAYFGYGMYLYYLSDKAGILRYTGIISDRRDEGIEYLQIAIENGRLTTIAAQASLIWILVEMNRYDEAIELAQSLQYDFPDSRAFLWGFGRALRKSGKYEESISAYQKLLGMVRVEKRNNHYNEIICLHALADANLKLENYTEVIRITNEARQLNVCDEVAREKEKEIKRIHKMHEQARELTN